VDRARRAEIVIEARAAMIAEGRVRPESVVGAASRVENPVASAVLAVSATSGADVISANSVRPSRRHRACPW
jgi:hypothetical protein